MTDKVKQEPDMVNHPPHYRSHPSGIEVIQITEHMGFCLGNVIKYVLRCDHKGEPLRDLLKARFYLDREIQLREKSSNEKVPEWGTLWRKHENS